MSRSRRRFGALLALGLASGLLLVPASFAGAGAVDVVGSPVVIRKVDSTDHDAVAVTFTCSCPTSDLPGLALQENGHDVDPSTALPLAEVNSGAATVIVIDASASTSTGMLDEFKAVAKDLVAARNRTDLVAVVSTGQRSAVRSGLSDDPAVLAAAIDRIDARSDGGVWAGVADAVDVLDDRPDLLASIVVLTDGNASGLPSDVRAEVIQLGAAVYGYGVQTGSLDPAPLEALARDTNGRYREGRVIGDAVEPVTEYAEAIAGSYELSFASGSDRGVNDLALKVGRVTGVVSYVSGSIQTGAHALAPAASPDPGGVVFLDFLDGTLGKVIAIGGGVIAVALFAYALAMVFVRDRSGLSAVLRPYSEGYRADGGDDEDVEKQGQAQTAIIQRAVELTEQFAERQGILTKAEVALERANLPLRAAEAIFFYAAAVVVLSALVLVISRNPIITLFAFVVLALLPPAALSFLAERRRKQFQAQLPDMLQLLAGTLRAGYSMMQGVEAVSQEVTEPMGRELRRVVTEARLGRPLEEALDGVAERMASRDFAWAVMAIRIQREVGGNLSELLMIVAETMTQRERLRRDIRSLTAEGRMSAIVLGILPPAIGAVMYSINPDYIKVLFDETAGQVMAIGGVLLALAGFLWMNKIVKIEV